MLEACDLRKRYGSIVAVDGVSFRIEPGETLGLLGPNGAGKTTTLSMISGIVSPDSGEVRIGGRPLSGDVDPLKMILGIVPQDLALYEDLSALHNLEYFGSLYGLDRKTLKPRIDEALGLVGLADRAKDPVATFSGGMKRRLNLAAALLHRPRLLLLDEPTVGIDPQSRNAIFDNLRELSQRGLALVYTTHYMEEAERLCDRIVIMDHGKVVAEGTSVELGKLLPGGNQLTIIFQEGVVLDSAVIDRVKSESQARTATWENGSRLVLDFENFGVGSARTLAALGDWQARIASMASERTDLETIFLNLTGRSLRDQ